VVDLVYNEAKLQMWSGNILILTDPIKVMLVTPDYIPDPDHTYVDDGTELSPVNFELDGTGYVAGFGSSDRLTLENRSLVRDDNTDRIRLFADPVDWNPISAGVAGAYIIMKEVTSDAESPLIAYVSSGGFPINTDGGELVITFNATNGVITLA
jgi:hypothetical protein